MKILWVLALGALLAPRLAAAQSMVIHYSDGTTKSILISDIKKVSFSTTAVAGTGAAHAADVVEAFATRYDHAARVLYITGNPSMDDPITNVGILSLQGRMVRKLKNSSAGMVAWDLRDESGRPVPEGAYVVAITTRQKAGCRKTVLVH